MLSRDWHIHDMLRSIPATLLSHCKRKGILDFFLFLYLFLIFFQWLDELQTHGYGNTPKIFVGLKQDLSLGVQEEVTFNQSYDNVAEEQYPTLGFFFLLFSFCLLLFSLVNKDTRYVSALPRGERVSMMSLRRPFASSSTTIKRRSSGIGEMYVCLLQEPPKS